MFCFYNEKKIISCRLGRNKALTRAQQSANLGAFRFTAGCDCGARKEDLSPGVGNAENLGGTDHGDARDPPGLVNLSTSGVWAIRRASHRLQLIASF